jgi:hypothetical protein
MQRVRFLRLTAESSSMAIRRRDEKPEIGNLYDVLLKSLLRGPATLSGSAL